MDSLNPDHPPVLVAPAKPPRVWKFWGTLLWGLVVFGAMFAGVPGAASGVLTDAASTGKFPYCANPALFETQELVRVSQPAGKDYLTLFVPRWPKSSPPEYRAIADGMDTLRDDGWRRVVKGQTTVEEVVRVTQQDEAIAETD